MHVVIAIFGKAATECHAAFCVGKLPVSGVKLAVAVIVDGIVWLVARIPLLRIFA